MKQNYRKTPPYMTKTGVQIGLLHQEPFEVRASKDADALQEALLNKKLYKPKTYINTDLIIVVISVAGIFVILFGGLYGLL